MCSGSRLLCSTHLRHPRLCYYRCHPSWVRRDRRGGPQGDFTVFSLKVFFLLCVYDLVSFPRRHPVLKTPLALSWNSHPNSQTRPPFDIRLTFFQSSQKGTLCTLCSTPESSVSRPHHPPRPLSDTPECLPRPRNERWETGTRTTPSRLTRPLFRGCRVGGGRVERTGLTVSQGGRSGGHGLRRQEFSFGLLTPFDVCSLLLVLP